MGNIFPLKIIGFDILLFVRCHAPRWEGEWGTQVGLRQHLLDVVKSFKILSVKCLLQQGKC